MDPWEISYRPSDKRICARCITDDDLKSIVADASDDEEICSFCGNTPSAPFDTVLDAIGDVISAEYTDPAEVLPFESREGGYQGTVYDGTELVWEMDSWSDNDAIIEEAAQAFAGTAWCETNYFSLNSYDSYTYGWRDFVRQIKHRTRYLFLRNIEGREDQHDEIAPHQMLDALDKLLTEHGAFSTIEPEVILYRARVHRADENPSTPEQRGPPPENAAKLSNRMSPAGVPMFYGALDEKTAVVETVDFRRAAGHAVTLARFHPVRPLTMLDLSTLASVPGQFESVTPRLRQSIQFLRSFVADLTKPILRDGSEHVEYVPTQVVTEYIRYVLRSPTSERIDGIIYSSSRIGGSKSTVVFIGQSGCGPRLNIARWEEQPLLLLESYSRREIAEFQHMQDNESEAPPV